MNDLFRLLACLRKRNKGFHCLAMGTRKRLATTKFSHFRKAIFALPLVARMFGDGQFYLFEGLGKNNHHQILPASRPSHVFCRRNLTNNLCPKDIAEAASDISLDHLRPSHEMRLVPNEI